MAELLLVDDDRALLEALTKRLRLELKDVEIDTCSTASLALERILQTDYDAIVVDLKTPGSEGIALLGLVRHLRPETPFILVTAEALQRGFSGKTAGAFKVLSKPVDPNGLIEAVTHALRRRTPRRQNLHRPIQAKTMKTVGPLPECNAISRSRHDDRSTGHIDKR